ncbi:MAG: hypothetical protein WC412_04885 [Candidatus Omnitrophota bacterium]|jgi:hypothetical protein
MSAKNIKGYFKIKENDLFYYPPIKQTNKLSHSFKISGKWRLDKKCNLVFDVDESCNDVFGQSIGFSAKIEHTSKDYLEISLLKRTTPSLRSVNSVKLRGRWKADNHNNFIFEVKRASGYDELIFGNNWQITKENQIVFFYKRKFLKKEIINSFILKGDWKLWKNAIVFSVENEKESRLKFRVAFNKKQVVFKKEKIDFTVGIEKSSLKSFSLFGKWKHVSDTLEFSTNSGQKKKKWIFRAKKNLSGGKELTFELINTKGKPLGIELTLSKKIFQDANLFVRVKKSTENRIEAGFYMPF